jgi:hypothetical protein
MPDVDTDKEPEEQPAAPASRAIEQQLAVMQEQIAALGRQVQRLNGDPDAPVTRADLYAALDELRVSPQSVPTPTAKRQLSDADVAAIVDGVLDGIDEEFVEEEEPDTGKKPKAATSKGSKSKAQADEDHEQPTRRGYFKD